MFSIDDRTCNVVTPLVIFLIAITVLYVARGAFVIERGAQLATAVIPGCGDAVNRRPVEGKRIELGHRQHVLERFTKKESCGDHLEPRKLDKARVASIPQRRYKSTYLPR